MTDRALYELLLSDPERGIPQLTRQYEGLVSSIIRKTLSGHVFSGEDTEECAADTFTEFCLGLSGFDPELGSIKTRLALLAQRNATDRLRLHYREPPTVPYDDVIGVESERSEKELNETLKRLVIGLGKPDRDILFRKFWLGQSSREIAKALKMTVSNVDTRTHRAIKKLRKELEDEYEG